VFFSGKIIDNLLISDKHYVMKISTPFIQPFVPGQFVMIRGWQGTDPLLPRPFAIYSWESSGGKDVLQIVYKIVGRGTVILSGLHRGDEIQINGPLGNGFVQPAGVEKFILAGGGIGFSSVFPVALYLREIGKKMKIILGAKGDRDIPPASSVGAKSLEGDVTYTTEDGTMGLRGLVTEVLEKEIDSIEEDDREKWAIFACGPTEMLSKVQILSADKNIQAFLSLENFMACGFGVCLGCVVKVSAPGGYQHVRVCKEGPVFSSKEVMFVD
jgi:dihydroorotate dehydrogenase electron transfer subunit